MESLKRYPLVFLLCGLVLAKVLPFLDRRMWGGAPAVQLLLEMLWFCLMYFGVLGRREHYRKKYGELAYRRIAVRFFIPAAILMMAGIVRSLWVMGAPLGSGWLWLRVLLGIYFVTAGLLLEYRGVQSLGLDRVLFFYTVFPEKGELVERGLYRFLRHPLYAAMTHLCCGIALLTGTWPGLLCAVIFTAKLFLWSKVEEKELIGRFGVDYQLYRQKVPAFWPRWSRIGSFWKELL